MGLGDNEYISGGEVRDDDGRLVVSLGSRVLGDGVKTVDAAGTAEPLVDDSTVCRWVIITALSTNTDLVCIGGETVDAATERGTPLAAGASVTIPTDDLENVYVDSVVNDEGVGFTYG